MAIKKVVKDYFTFSKKEGIAAIVLALFIGGFIALPYLIKSEKKKPVIDKTMLDEVTKLQSSNTNSDSSHSNYKLYPKYSAPPNQENTTFEPFNFDPNTVDEAGWHKLGLRDKTIHTLMNYRSKGGQFRQSEDIKKIWGLRPEEAARIIPYVHIVGMEAYKKKEYAPYKSISTKPMIVDINLATAEQLRNIPGMGNGLLFRILKYKERLGGFLSIDQVKEVYGMSDSAFVLMQPFLKLASPVITKININTATDYDLSGHPYIDKNVAKAIVLYRLQHGSYQSINDIMKIVFIKEPLFQKISPYLTVQ